MSWKRIIYPLIIILFWSIPLGWFGGVFDATRQWVIAGLIIGGIFALIGELIDNWLARSLSLLLILGTILGVIIPWLLFGPGLLENSASIEHVTSDYGAGVPNIAGLLELTLHSGAVAVAIGLGAFVGGFTGFGSGLIGSIIMRVRRGRVRTIGVPANVY